jgi:hypothetical protein
VFRLGQKAGNECKKWAKLVPKGADTVQEAPVRTFLMVRKPSGHFWPRNPNQTMHNKSAQKLGIGKCDPNRGEIFDLIYVSIQ